MSMFRSGSKSAKSHRTSVAAEEQLEEDIKIIAQYEEEYSDENLTQKTRIESVDSEYDPSSKQKIKLEKKPIEKTEEYEDAADYATTEKDKRSDVLNTSEKGDPYQNVFQTLQQQKKKRFSKRSTQISHIDEDDIMPKYRDSGERKRYIFDLATVVKYDKPETIKAPKPGAIPTLIIDPVEEALTKIFPPRCWKHKNKMYRQCVSKIQASDQNNVALLETLLHRVKDAGVDREKWCPLRYNIYIDCFNEVIRQITINCPERGLLVARMRDEIDLSLSSFSTLVCSAANFGNRKSIQLQEEIGHLEHLLEGSLTIKNRLDEIIDELILANEDIKFRLAEERALLEKNNTEELNFHRKMNVQLKTLMESLTSQP